MDQTNQPATPPAEPKAQGDRKTIMAVLAYVLFLIPLLAGDAKKDEFVKFHTKQGFALFLVAVALTVLGWIIPFYFWWYQIVWLLNLGLLILFILGIVNAAGGKKTPLPVIGQLGDLLKI
jgi:uncharacterized membrane protein